MKQLNVYFEDEEYNKMSKVKEKLNLSWHDFMLLLTEKEAQIIKNGKNK